MWHLANPPINLAQMTDPERSPCWVESYNKALKITADLAYNEANPVAVATKVAETFGVTDIPPGNRTMGVFIQAVLDHLTIRRPVWFDPMTGDLLPPDAVADKRSIAVLEAEEEARAEADRAAKRAARAAEKAAAEKAANVTGIAAALAAFPQLQVAATNLVNSSTFEAASETLANASEQLASAGIVHEYAVQALLSLLPHAWVRPLADGSFKLRPAPLKEKPSSLGKKDKAVLRAVYGFVDKYGIDMVRANLLRAFPGSTLADIAPREVVAPDIVVVDDEEPAQ